MAETAEAVVHAGNINVSVCFIYGYAGTDKDRCKQEVYILFMQLYIASRVHCRLGYGTVVV